MNKRIPLVRRATTWAVLVLATYCAPAMAAEGNVGLSHFAFRATGDETPINAYVFYPTIVPV